MKLRQIALVPATFLLALPLAAQMMGSRVPTLSGVWHPVVGTGASYEVTKGGGEKSQFEITIVGKEDVDGQTNYWTEFAMTDPRMGGEMYAKNLMAVKDNTVTTVRTIFQMPGRDPMEMDAGMQGRRGTQNIASDFRDKAELVGTETVTVPAGTFTCQHYREKDGSADAWISDKVGPWGLVKSQDKDSSIVLTKTITDAKDHITGTPTKFDPMQMMRDRTGQGRQ
ncbi:MAG: hypothetical protein ACRD4Y_06600 [Candidatus Acidiferrales bacterium]